MGNEAIQYNKSDVWVVIAAYNEARIIKQTIAGVKNWAGHIVIVDDGSRDATAREARETGVVVVVHPINRGQGASLRTGIELALQYGAHIIVTFDADGQFSHQEIPDMVLPVFRNEVDITIGSRFQSRRSNVPPFRRYYLACFLFKIWWCDRSIKRY